MYSHNGHIDSFHSALRFRIESIESAWLFTSTDTLRLVTKIQTPLWRKHRARSSRRELRTQFQRLIWAGALLVGYFLVSLYILSDIESPGEDSNILMLLLGATIVGVVGAWIGPKISASLGFQPKQRARQNKHADRHRG